MIIELFALLIGVSFLFMFFADYKTRKPFFTIAAGFILTFMGIMLGLSPLVYPIGTISTVSEYDAYCNVTDLFPEMLTDYADAVSTEEGTYVSGTLANTHSIDQQYLVYQENGANFNVTYNFSWYEYECPEHLHWTGRYDAPANREFDWYTYNWTHDVWTYVGDGTPVSSSASDQSIELSEDCTTDFINVIGNTILIKQVSSNSAVSNYKLYTDAIYLDTESVVSYAQDTRVVNCTVSDKTLLDSNSNLDEDFNLMISLFLIMLGLGTFLYGVITVFGREQED